MKKHIIILAAFFAAALLISGCYPEDTPGLKNQGLKISLYCGEPETKADPFAFENNIDHFDFFFFKDALGRVPISGMHNRVVGSEEELDTSENGEYSALRTGTSYVYILANYPGSINHQVDWTLADLLALEIDDPIVTEKETEINPITGDLEETGKVTYCSALVMDSYQKADGTNPATYMTQLTPRDIEEEREVTIELTRIASKLELIINVAHSVPGSMTYTDSHGEVRQEVWTPVLKDLHAYFVNALNNIATVSAEPIQRSTIQDADSYEYLTYPTLYTLTADVSDPYQFTSYPAYTYPQEWDDTENGEPYFKIQIPWQSTLRGSTPFYYKVALPKSENNKRTINRNMYYQVTVDLSVIDTENEYVELNGSYVVTPWLTSGWTGGGHVKPAKFFNVPVTDFELYSQEEVSVPYYSSSPTKAYLSKIEYYYYGGGAGEAYRYTYTEADNKTSVTLHSSSSTSVPVAARDLNTYSLVPGTGNSWKLTHSLNKIYTARTIQFVIKNLETGASETVTVTQHPALEIKSMATDNFFVNGHFGRATANIHVPGKPGVVVGVPFTTKRCEPGVVRYHSDDNRWTNTTYESHASNSDNNTSYWFQGTDNYASTGSWQDAPSVECNITEGRYGWVVSDGYKRSGGVAPYLVKLTVSAFNENNNTYTYKQGGATIGPKKFILGDPRVEGGSIFNELKKVSGSGNKGAYLYKPSTVRSSNDSDISVGTSAAVYKAWTNPEKIKITSNDPNNGQTIAPRILLSSYYNGQPAALSYENARKRAATYQEAGYPAGRWRLPTEAEIMFLVWCQQQGIISAVWANRSTYWCADGRYVKIADGGDYVTFYEADQNTTVVNRFVYDLWYWGDDPMDDQEQYWPNGHLASPNDKTGSTFTY